MLEVGSLILQSNKSMYRIPHVICLDINFDQLKVSAKKVSYQYNSIAADLDLQAVTQHRRLHHINGSARMLPFSDHSIDRIIALESHYHFKPLKLFIQESNRVLDENGLLIIIASAIKTNGSSMLNDIVKLGILSLTFNSKNYVLAHIKLALTESGFNIKEILSIGAHVYEPLANYYTENRHMLKQSILEKYPGYSETAIYKLILKTREAYQKGMIDYVLIKCSPS
jgi:ubiquinone/menaquinone biosynthesis C-methylase UbiE